MKITILGAAGVRTPLIIEAVAERQERLGLDELALMDIDAERMGLIEALASAHMAGKKLDFKITHTSDARQALYGADYVITTFRVGGIASRVIDERVPLGYSVLGQETTGPGGFAMAMRTIPVLVDYLRLMREVCPDAWVLNFANPAGMLAEVILRVEGWPRAAGICDAPASMLRAAAGLLQAKAGEVFLDYFGLNHLGWVRSVIHNGEDVLPEFLHQIEQAGGMPELPFSNELMQSLRLIPNEYLFYYYSRRMAVDNILKSGVTRGEMIAGWNEELVADLRRLYHDEDPKGMLAAYHTYIGHRGETYMAAETGRAAAGEITQAAVQEGDGGGYAGVALDLIEALDGTAPGVLILNVLNQGAIAGMDPLDVVEIPAYVGPGFVRPLAVGKVPDHCLGLMKQVKAYERLTIEAALEGSFSKARQALAQHPLVGDEVLAEKILKGYQEQHGASFPALS